MKVCQVWYAVTKKLQTILHIACEDLAGKLVLGQLSHILSLPKSYQFVLMMLAWTDKGVELFLRVFTSQVVPLLLHLLTSFSYTF